MPNTIIPQPTIDEWKAIATMQNTEEHFPNGLKVSKADNPMFFPVENAYQVGSAEIMALMSNTIAVGTGQTGDAPLYVFCKDGVYALFVDASGQMTYSNSRVLARDVCNNPRSVTPIDAGVVFTTDRGLMMIAGEQVEEIGAPAEGDVLQFADSTKGDYIKMAAGAFANIADLPDSILDTTDFLTYLSGAIINYNHNMRELIVTNPGKSYSYILDREGNWSRRDYTATEYLSNYPTSYRVVDTVSNNVHTLSFYKLDEEGNSDTPLEQKKKAANRIFYLSREIKLDSIGFKKAERFVVRGYLETLRYIEDVAITEFDSARKVLLSPTTEMHDAVMIGSKVFIGDKEYKVTSKLSNSPYSITFDKAVPTFTGTLPVSVEEYAGCYIFGSYDGRKYAMLGGNEKRGKFTDIGCKIEQTDVKFLRICLAGYINESTRINYMEMSFVPSMLNTKIR